MNRENHVNDVMKKEGTDASAFNEHHHENISERNCCSRTHHNGEGHHHDHDGESCCSHDEEEIDVEDLDHSKLTAHGMTCAKCSQPMDRCRCIDEHTVVTQKIYNIDGLDCADCAAKVERGIGRLEGISNVNVAYVSGQLRVSALEPDRYINAMNAVAGRLEPGVVISPRARSVAEDRRRRAEEKKTGLREWFFGEAYTKVQAITGAVLFVAGLIAEHSGLAMAEQMSLVLYIAAYFFIGTPVVLKSLMMIFKGQFFDENFLMTIATIGAFVIHEYPEAVGVMLFNRIGEYFEDKASDRSRNQIMEAVDMRPEVVNRVEQDGGITVIPSEKAAVGDVLIVRPGDRIPLDGVILEGESRIDTSPVTGEPVPVRAVPGDEIVSGCVNTSGTLRMKVERPLGESMVTKILDSVENAAASKPKMDRFITRFSRWFTPFVIAAALCTAVIPPLAFGGDWNHWIYTALSFLVISCPCALVLSVPLAFFSGIGAGSKLGILFKGGMAIETLNKVKAVVMDKTGTITEGNFVVQKILPAGMSENELLSTAASCEIFSTHPIGESIVRAAEEKGLAFTEVGQIEEISGHGIKGIVDGQPVLCGNEKMMKDHGIDIPEDAVSDYGTLVYLAKNGIFAGTIVIADTIKAGAKDAVTRLHRQGMKTVMLTGDTEGSAEAVAEQTGIDSVRAKLLPEDKLNALKQVRQENGAVMFVGDGINDAPVLAGADVGAAMGSGADAAIEAADVVFMNSDLDAVPEAVDIAKQTGRVAKANVIFALSVKAVVMILGFIGFANMWLAVFADTGVAMLCVLNSTRILYKKRELKRKK